MTNLKGKLDLCNEFEKGWNSGEMRTGMNIAFQSVGDGIEVALNSVRGGLIVAASGIDQGIDIVKYGINYPTVAINALGGALKAIVTTIAQAVSGVALAWFQLIIFTILTATGQPIESYQNIMYYTTIAILGLLVFFVLYYMSIGYELFETAYSFVQGTIEAIKEGIVYAISLIKRKPGPSLKSGGRKKRH